MGMLLGIEFLTMDFKKKANYPKGEMTMLPLKKKKKKKQNKTKQKTKKQNKTKKEYPLTCTKKLFNPLCIAKPIFGLFLSLRACLVRHFN